MSEQNPLGLEEVQAAFARWRASGRISRTPPSLRAQAVELLRRYRIGEVIKALGVDHQRLSRWRLEFSSSGMAVAPEEFVELPPARLEAALAAPGLNSFELTLTRQACDGSRLSIQGELSAAQWRWALALLQESAP
jgi:hypothetical protein